MVGVKAVTHIHKRMHPMRFRFVDGRVVSFSLIKHLFFSEVCAANFTAQRNLISHEILWTQNRVDII